MQDHEAAAEEARLARYAAKNGFALEVVRVFHAAGALTLPMDEPDEHPRAVSAWDAASPSERRAYEKRERKREAAERRATRDFHAGRISQAQWAKRRDRARMDYIAKACCDRPPASSTMHQPPRSRESHRGSKLRGAARRTSALSGDGPDDDPDPESPPAPRLCAGCEAELPPQSGPGRPPKWCSNCKGKVRGKLYKREERRRKDPIRYPGRDADPHLTVLHRRYTGCVDCGRPWLSDLEPGRCPACGGRIAFEMVNDLDALMARASASCRCNGGPSDRHGYHRDESYILGHDGECLKCGHERHDGFARLQIALWKRIQRAEAKSAPEGPRPVRAASAEPVRRAGKRHHKGQKLKVRRTTGVSS